MHREENLISAYSPKFFGRVVWLLVFIAISFLVFNRHQNTGYFNWRSKMWADQAGYYVYLPSFFLYGMNGGQMPDNIVAKTGDGFSIDEDGKIITRYTAGVAIMQAPFFVAIHALAGLTGQEQDGFSGLYHYVSSVAAIYYAFLGLLLLYIYLMFYFKKSIVILSLLSIFLGTNLLYYTIDATGMSHIYSFFLFALLLLASKLFFAGSTGRRTKNLWFLVIAFTSALIVLLRPTNLVFVALVFLLDTHSRITLIARFRHVFTPVRIIMVMVAFAFVFLPQMLYWKYASGSYITDSYQGYGFSNWASPQIAKFLFSPNNGMFLYNPLYFLIVLALVIMIRHKKVNGYYIVLTLAGLIYLFSSWFIFSFGCGFGSRNFVEYTTVFTLPLGFLFSKIENEKKIIKSGVAVVLVLFIMMNVKLTSAYDKCFVGGDWEFREYTHLLKIRKHSERTLFFRKDLLTEEKEFSKGINVNLKYNTCANYRRAIVSLTAELFEENSEAVVVIAVTAADSTIYWNGYNLSNDYDFNRAGEPQRIKADFSLPRSYTTNSVISSYVWNVGKDSLYISKFKVSLE